jgi:SAM-dependent methyltransferase
MRDAKPNHYGLITLFDVIEHLPKPDILALLGNIAKALRPGGIFIAHCPNGNSPFALRVFAADLTHETLLNETSARHLCVLSGLDHFGAAEHLGASRSLSGLVRQAAWGVMRTCIRVMNGVETGSLGSKVLTRNFAFKAEKPLAVKAPKK